jgi:uncharacterized membrane protein YdjX (TVP38/TMEM64 family)
MRKTDNKITLFLIILSILILGWMLYSYFNNGIIYDLVTSDIESLVLVLQGFEKSGAVVFLLLVTLEAVVAPIPPLVLYLAGGLVFGTFFGGLLALIGNVLGAVIAFLIAKRYGRKIIENKIKEKERERFDRFSKRYGGFALFILRLNPFTSSDIFSYLAGLTDMKLKTLILGTALGLAPLIFVQTYLGSDIISESPILSLIFIWVGVIYLLIFIVGLVALAMRRKKI